MGRSPQRAQKKTLGNGASVIELPILLENNGVNVRHRLQFCLFYSRVKAAKTSRREEIKGRLDRSHWNPGVREKQNQVLQTLESAPRTETELVPSPPPVSLCSVMLCLWLGSGLLLLTCLSDPAPLCLSLGISWGREQLALPWHTYRTNLLLSKLRPPTQRASGLLRPPPHRVGDLLL